MIVFRLCRARHARDLSGKGAELAGGRWNSRGVGLLYTAESRALCTAELAVHLPLGNLPEGYQMVAIEAPQHSVGNIERADLPADWDSFPYAPFTQQIGDEFVRSGSLLVLRVPSAVVQGEYNCLINPKHADFGEVKILDVESYCFDRRLFF